MKIDNKVAVVTGVSKGIGFEVVKQLLEKGAKVFGLGRNNNDLINENYCFIKCDVQNYEEVCDAFSKIFSLTNSKIDILVNNAGLGYFGFLEQTSVDEWRQMMNTNVDAIFYCCKNALPSMKKNEHGHIINIASIAALEGYPQASAYCSSKWAVKGLSEALFREVRDFKIKVTCIYPGSTKTDFFKNSPNIQAHDFMLMPQDVAITIVQAIEMPENFHTVNLEIRPLQPKGPSK